MTLSILSGRVTRHPGSHVQCYVRAYHTNTCQRAANWQKVFCRLVGMRSTELPPFIFVDRISTFVRAYLFRLHFVLDDFLGIAE